jgi:hypothetical protein
MKIDLFQDGNTDFTFLMDGYGHNVNINGTTVKALVAARTVDKSIDDRVLKTLTPLKRGDSVVWQGKPWLVVSQVSASRFGVFKGVIRPCSHEIQVHIDDLETITGYDNLGRPIMYSEPIYVTTTCIVEGRNVYIEGTMIRLPVNEITVTMQDNTENQKIQLNHTFEVLNDTYTVEGIDLTKVGLITINAKG